MCYCLRMLLPRHRFIGLLSIALPVSLTRRRGRESRHAAERDVVGAAAAVLIFEGLATIIEKSDDAAAPFCSLDPDGCIDPESCLRPCGRTCPAGEDCVTPVRCGGGL